MIRKILSTLTLIAFSVSTLITPASARMMTLPAPGTMVAPSTGFNPVVIQGLKVFPENPLQFEFIIDAGDLSEVSGQSSEVSIKEETQKLVRYFLASLAVPEEEMWVNLSPYEKNRIVPEQFGRTQMGRDLLAQDYLLKQITSSMMHPQGEVGKKLWSRIHAKARAEYGDVNIPINTFNKVWIVPQTAEIYTENNVAFITESHLKVMLEEDYVALENHRSDVSRRDGFQTRPDNWNGLKPFPTAPSSQIIREIVIPELEREVNNGQHFAKLRQIYNSMILATWYKYNVQNSVVNQLYSNRRHIAGIESDDPNAKQKIYDAYTQAFQKGAYDTIIEEYDPVTQDTVPTQYFSGGVSLAADSAAAMTAAKGSGISVYKKAARSLLTVGVTLLGMSGGYVEAVERAKPGWFNNVSQERMYVVDGEIDPQASKSKGVDLQRKKVKVRHGGQDVIAEERTYQFTENDLKIAMRLTVGVDPEVFGQLFNVEIATKASEQRGWTKLSQEQAWKSYAGFLKNVDSKLAEVIKEAPAEPQVESVESKSAHIGFTQRQKDIWEKQRKGDTPLWNELYYRANAKNKYGDVGEYDALLYAITGDQEDAENAFKHMLNQIPGKATRNDTRHSFLRLAKQYGLIKSGLSEEERLDIRNKLDAWVDLVSLPLEKHGPLGKPHGTRTNDSDEMVGHYFGAAVYALVIADEDPEKSKAILKRIGGLDATGANTETWRNTIARYATLFKGGVWMEASGYNANTTAYLADGIHTINSILGEDKFPEYAGIWDDWAKALVHSLTPDFRNSFQWGDEQDPGYIKLFSHLQAIALAAYLTDDPQAYYVFDQWKKRLGDGPAEPRWIYFVDPDKPREAPSGWSVHNAEGMGFTFVHTGWTENDFSAGFMTKPWTGVDHQSNSFQNFVLFRGSEPVLTYPIGYGAYHYEQMYSNGFMVFGAFPLIDQENKGQIDFIDGGDYVYHAGRADGKNQKKKSDRIDHYTRQFLFHRGVIVTVDRIDASKPHPDQYRKEVRDMLDEEEFRHAYILHTPEDAVEENGTYTWTAQSGDKVVVRPYYELRPSIGPDPNKWGSFKAGQKKRQLRFLIDSKPGMRTFLTTINPTDLPVSAEEVNGNWVVTIDGRKFYFGLDGDELVFKAEDKAMTGVSDQGSEVSGQKEETSAAMTPGGIDLDPAKLAMNTIGEPIQMQMPRNIEFYQDLFNQPIIPQILHMTPVVNLSSLFDSDAPFGTSQEEIPAPVNTADEGDVPYADDLYARHERS